MKKIEYLLLLLLVSLTTLSSCKVFRSGAFGADTDIDPTTHIDSRHNKYDLIVANEGVEYTIDISTPDGKLKLNKLSLSEAKKLVTDEAAIHYRCAMLVRPKYTYLKEGKHILRITVFGFPANYKNSKDYDYVPEQNRTKSEVIVKHR